MSFNQSIDNQTSSSNYNDRNNIKLQVFFSYRFADYTAIGQMHIQCINSLGAISVLTHCGLVTPYGDRDLGQHWLR